MTSAVIVAVIAATPPTIGATLSYLATRSARREASREQASTAARTVDVLGNALERLQTTTDRVEAGVADLRDRVSRLEGAASFPHPHLHA